MGLKTTLFRFLKKKINFCAFGVVVEYVDHLAKLRASFDFESAKDTTGKYSVCLVYEKVHF